MDKKLGLILLAWCAVVLLAALPPEWESFQRDIGRQAGQYKDSAEHLAYRQRDTRNYQVGDTKTFWRWNLSVMPPTWIQTPATCRAVGAYSYVFVADAEWNVHMTQANVDTIMVRLEQNTPNNPNMGAVQMDIGLFGDIPDELDNDPKLIVFYSALGSFQGNYFDGYFSAYNQVTEAQAQQMNPPGHSNECEMIYMTCYPLSPVAPIRMSVLAHELEHLIHWGQDSNEQAWLDEGCAELAMVAYGIPDPISGFNSNPDNDLTAWNQTTADYVKVMLFFTYMYEHYDSSGLVRTLVEDPNNGISSLATQLELHFPGLTVGEVLRNWTIANALDSPEQGNGLYNYQALNLPNFNMTSVNYNPNLTNQSIQAYAADYLFLDVSTDNRAVNIQVNTPIYITTLLMDESGVCTAVLHGALTDSLIYNPMPSGADNVIFVLTNHNASAVSYSYSSAPVDIDEELAVTVAMPVVHCYPNPFQQQCHITLELQTKTTMQMEVFNVKGQKVRSLANLTAAPGSYSYIWNGRDDNGIRLGSGIYYVRLAAGEMTTMRKVLLIN